MPMTFTEAEKERFHEQDLKRIKNFRPIDDTFMRAIFRDNLPLAQHVLRVVTGLSNLVLTEEKTQADMNRVTGARSICLDVYGKDTSGKRFDLEVQKASAGTHPKRARYHSSVFDIENLDVKQDFDELPETYIIFITENDVYQGGYPFYLFERTDTRDGSLFGDEEHILYINGAYRGDDELGHLMHDFCCSNPDDMYNEDMADSSRYFKESEKGVSEMCTIMEDLRQESIEIGREKGMEEGMEKGMEKGMKKGMKKGRESALLRTLKNLLRNNPAMSAEQAMNMMGIPSKEQEKFMELIK